MAPCDIAMIASPRSPIVAANGAASTRGPACSFITRAEKAQLLDAPIGSIIEENSAGTTSCAYPPGAPDRYAQAEIEIEWHHDGSSSLEQYKIAADRMSTGGFGASQPQATNDTPDGRARNRRVELVRQ